MKCLTNTLGRESRLTKAENFQRIFEHARKFRHDGLSVLVIENDLNYSRICVCIAKKQIQRAVDRNRIRRVVKEHFRVKRNSLINKNVDMVFFVYSAVLKLSKFEINECLDTLWAKVTNYYKCV